MLLSYSQIVKASALYIYIYISIFHIYLDQYVDWNWRIIMWDLIIQLDIDVATVM